MSIENIFDWHDAPMGTIEPQESSEYLSDTDHSVAPYDDAHIVQETYQAYDEGYLDEVPWALEAYMDHDQLIEGR